MSEFLREEQGEGQITQQQNGKNQRDDRDESMCMGLPQLLARLDVEKRQGEENYREQQHHHILHCESSQFRGNAAQRDRLRSA